MFDPVQNAYDVPPERGVYCNRTLNLRSIQAIGYDMDYTLIHYNMAEWEARAFEHTRRRLADRGWPVDQLDFEPNQVMRGLAVDRERGNIVKANRFGYIKQAAHGTEMLEFGKMRDIYARTLVDHREERWYFLNTLFSISAASMYRQLVDLLDAGDLPTAIGYDDLWEAVQEALDAAHLEGMLKEEIMDEPERFVELDPEMPLTLRDQKEAGNKLLLITNSGWKYTRFMMSYAFDRFLPDGETWRELFDIAVVAAGKPDFFLTDKPIFKLANEEGLVEPVVGAIPEDGIYLGGNASLLEEYLGISGDRILFVGDHLISDVNISKDVSRWRTALILRELEGELTAIQASKERQEDIQRLMDQKVALEREISKLRLKRQRLEADYGPDEPEDDDYYRREIDERRDELRDIDDQIGPLVAHDGEEFNPQWGYLMRAGNDKSYLTRQVERYADLYTSRVSNFLEYTPHVYFRAPRTGMPHDQGEG
jgi:HAD superfamily 5'-nucleotidase-like hydrolase